MIEPDATAPIQLDANGQTRIRKPLVIKRANADELSEHDQVLLAIDKESKGACVWLPKE
jgi:DNA polymerase-3 subunit epsilon